MKPWLSLNMTGNYYDEILAEIDDLIRNGKAEEAETLVNRELSMPYIPPEAEEKLKKQKKEIVFALSENTGRTVASADEILSMLKGNEQQQLAGAAALHGVNLREYTKEIQEWLQADPFPEAAALAIEEIAEQEVGDEFVIHKDGTEYAFWGDAVTPAPESTGFREAWSCLKKWLSDDHPDILNLAQTLLVHEAYMFLPLSYEKGEGEVLAMKTLKNISAMMDDGKIYEETVKRYGLTDPFS